MIKHIEYFDVCYDKNKYKQCKKEKNNEINLIYVNNQRKSYKIKVIKKLTHRIKKLKCNNIILSKEIKNILLEHGIDFIKEKNQIIYRDNIIQIINNVIKMGKSRSKEESLYVLIKSNILIKYQDIINIMNNYKSINIITPNIKNFIKLEQKLEEENELISVSNNRRKSLIKAKYILNVDFTEEDLLEYNVNRKAIIFNTWNNKIEHIYGFDGIIVNNIKLEENAEERFDLEDEYEKNKEIIINKIIENKYQLIGKNGFISYKELLKLQANLGTWQN